MNSVRTNLRLGRWRRLLRAGTGRRSVWSLLMILLPGHRAAAAALPEERGDVLYHFYDGGGQRVQGPALLIRKNFAEKFSVSGGYYVDRVSGASIDVITNASPYVETRTEYNVGAEYLYRDTLISASYTGSNEHDFKAKTYDVSVSQDFFQNTTTLTLGFSRGRDKIGRVDTDFSARANRAGYSASLAQVLTPSLIGSLTYELTADDGYLQNPYRSARVLGASVPEIYPGTRTGHAATLKLIKSWSPRWSTRIESRYYTDTWKINALNVGIGASEYVYRDWILDGTYRYYTQKAASFYSDNFPRPLNFIARDKELASFDSHTFGAKLTAPLYKREDGLVSRVSVSLALDYIIFNYRDFTDIRNGKLYGFNATVGQLFFTANY